MPLDSCPQPIAAISRMQRMLERISPALGRGAITNQGTAEDRDCVSSDDSLQSASACEIAIGSSSATPASVQSSVAPSQNSPGKYSELLAVIEELGKDIRPTYAGSKNAAERLKKGIMHARVLVRECLVETDRCARQ
ncbi:uncharacterized protein [Porites lutea]|uniref:uncharacterized protein isoform X1 n=1 Tax=Porites lutea TaxID=51062 RepID=UPI003CC5671D